jgi:iron complex transport system substrate-binding protein
MADEVNDEDGPTRREYVKFDGAVIGGGLLAGCVADESTPAAGASDSEPTATLTPTPPTTPDEGPAAARTEESTESDASTATPDQSYSVTMEPVGTVELDAVPETVAPFTADYVDMLVALDHGNAVESIWYRGRYKTIHYDELPGVSVDLDGLTQLWSDGISKEPFYEIDADLHLIDPHALTDWFQAWDQSDLEEIRGNVAPFVGNVIFRRTDSWHDYRYYSLYEAFEKVAQIFQEEARFEAIESMHDDLVADVQSRLPAPDDRPNAALMWGGREPEKFYPYRLSGNGANKEHFHTLGLSDAFAGTGVDGLSTADTSAIDYETLLEVDPDSLLVRYHESGMTRETFERDVVQHMRDHPVGGELTAVREGRVFRGGPIYSGPLHNLFMIERYATGYFPEEFGEDELIDRDRLASIVTDGVEA